MSIPGGTDVPGAEWKRRPELEELLGLKRSAVESYIKKAIEVGRIEMRKFRVNRGDGCFHYLPHFRIIG